MRKKIGLVAAMSSAVLGLALTVPAATATAASGGGGDWVSVTQVLVNRLGGVNVSGQVSCAGTYQQIRSGNFSYQDENGQPVTIVVTDTDKVNLAANNDEYTVTQPAGKKSMIQATHQSSRMNPCYVEYAYNPDGTPLPDWISCAAAGTPCRWETDNFGYDHDALGPLFDYSQNGKFKAGSLNVFEQSVGLLVMVFHADGGSDQYYVPEGSYSMTSTNVRAVNYRG